MFDEKQEVKIIVKSKDAFAYVADCLTSFKKSQQDQKDFIEYFTSWYWGKSENGEKPVRMKTKMDFFELMIFLYGIETTSNLNTKIFCEDGVFVLP